MNLNEYLEWIKTLDLDELRIVLARGIMEIDDRKQKKAIKK